MSSALEKQFEGDESSAYKMDLRDENGNRQNKYPSIKGEESEAYLEFKEGVIKSAKEAAEELESRNPGEEISIGRVDGLPTTGEQAENYGAKDYAKWFEGTDGNIRFSKELLELGIIALPEHFRIKSRKVSEIENFRNKELIELADAIRRIRPFLKSFYGEEAKIPSSSSVYLVRNEKEDHYDIGEVSRAMFSNDRRRSPRSHKSVELFMKKLNLTPKQEELFNKVLHAGGIRRIIHGATSRIKPE